MYPSFFRIKISHILVFCLLAVTACNQKKEAPVSGPRKTGAVSVEAIVIQSDSLSNIINTTGTLLPNEKVELRNEVTGRVTDIFFTEGAEVKKGMVLLKIDDRDLQAQFNKVSVQEKMARDDEYRKGKLLDIKAISQEEYDIALNQLKSVEAEKKILEAQLAKTVIIAPLSGKIGLRYVSPGSYIPSNSLIATLQSIDPIKVEFSVPEKYNTLIHKGMSLSFRVDYTPDTFEGKVYASESGIDTGTRTIMVRGTCPNPSGALVPGAFARINLVLEEIPEAILIPSESIIGDINGSNVFVIVNGKAKSVRIQTGIRTEKDVQITQGLQPGDSLIVSGLLQISDGTLVLAKGSPSGMIPKTNQ
jgi:membrane fusion protein (multidrug efflux system)